MNYFPFLILFSPKYQSLDYHSATGLLLQAPAALHPTDVTILIIICLLLMLLSAIVSGSEVAYFSLTTKDLDMLKMKENTNARLIPALLERPRLLMSALVTTATVTDLAIIFILNNLLEQLVSTDQDFALAIFLKIVIISIVLLLCCEILPKVYAMQNNLRMALFATPVVSGLLNILEPVCNASLISSDWLSNKIFRKKRTPITSEDIDEAIELSVNESASTEEKNMLRSIISFGNITAKQIMRTRLDVFGIEYNIPFKALITQVSDLHYSRLPVYKGNLDNIAGMIHTKDLLPHLHKKESFDWHEVMRQPYYIHEHKLIEDLLKEFQKQHIHFAIVVDEFGGTSGIVTLEDIMEEVIGDIKDEFDKEESSFKKVDDSEYIFEGKTMLNDVCRILDISPSTFEDVIGESNSLGGLILEIAGSFPEVNQVISYKSFDFTVLEVNKMRIQKVKITVKPETEDFEK
ncbi:MAG: gliding motility-associated protein GldE [Chitinophagaceae bacterium]